jgi:hypothetical protein
MNPPAFPDPGIQVEGRQRHTVEILDHRSIRVADHIIAAPEREAR